MFKSVGAVRTLRKCRNHQTMEAKKSNQLRKEQEETKTTENDQRNFAPRLKELVSEDRHFKPTHQTMGDERKTAIHQEVQLHQKSSKTVESSFKKKAMCSNL